MPLGRPPVRPSRESRLLDGRKSLARRLWHRTPGGTEPAEQQAQRDAVTWDIPDQYYFFSMAAEPEQANVKTTTTVTRVEPVYEYEEEYQPCWVWVLLVFPCLIPAFW